MADAIGDRLIHSSLKLTFKGESLRKLRRGTFINGCRPIRQALPCRMARVRNELGARVQFVWASVCSALGIWCAAHRRLAGCHGTCFRKGRGAGFHGHVGVRQLAMLATHPSAPDAYAQVVTDKFELLRKQLEHELCGELWTRFGVTEYQASRSEQEQACCLQTRSMIRAALRDSSSRADDWIEVLCRVASSVNERDMRVRTMPAFAVSKQVGYWEFPPFDVVEPQLRRLHGALVSKRSSPFFQAMLSLVGITFLHPFLDGNG